MQLKVRILFYAITILLGVPATRPCAQSFGRDDERIWIDFEARGRLDPDPSNSDYRGGSVSFHVSGLLEPAEYDDSSLVGYGGWELPFTLSIEPCKFIDPTDGSVMSESSCRRNAQGKIIIHLRFNLETGLGELALNSSDLASCVAGKPPDRYTADAEIMYYIGSIEDREIHPSPPLILTRDDLETDFEKHWSWDMEYMGLGQFTNCPLLWTINMTLSSKPPERTKVSIAGCANILIGVSANLTATGEPKTEGTYSWSADPADVFSISGSGSTATITGKSAGHATIKVEYQPKRGKKIEATLPGSVVELLSVNGGADIPQIGLYDETGASRPPVQVPTVQDPPDGALLRFPVADRGVATVENLGTGLVIRGVREGVTTARGQTACGDQDEHTITIEVVPCDKETIQKLRDELEELKRQRDEILDEHQRRLKDPEFSRATKEVDKSLSKCLVKLLSIAASTLGAAEGAVTGAMPSPQDPDNIADMLGDFYDATEKGTWEGDWSLWDMYWEYQFGFARKITLGIANDVYEYGEAWFAAHDALAVMKKVVAELKELRKQYKEAAKKYNEVDRRLFDVCKDKGHDTGEPGASEPPQPPIESQDRKPAEPPMGSKPSSDQSGGQPPADESSGDGGEQPPTDESTNQPDDDDIIWDPPFPPGNPPSSGGFPIECDCEKWDKSASDGQVSLGQVGRGIDMMLFCMERFEKETLKPIEMANDSTRKLLDEIEIGLALPESQRAKAFQDILPRLGTARDRVKSLGNELVSFKTTSEGCSEASKQMVGAIEQSAILGDSK